MKKSFILLFALLLSMGLFTSCSSSDDTPTPKEVTGTWTTVPTVIDETTGNVSASSVHLVWEAPDTVKVMGFLDIPTTINMAEGLGGQFLEKILQSVTFADNGDISAIYSTTIPSFTNLSDPTFTSNWTNSGTGLISFDGGLSGTLNLKLNLTNIAAKDADFAAVIKENPTLSSLLSQTFPGKYRISGNVLTVYLDKTFMDNTVLPIINAMAPTITDDEFDGMGALIKPILYNAKYWAKVTTKFEIGLKFNKSTATTK